MTWPKAQTSKLGSLDELEVHSYYKRALGSTVNGLVATPSEVVAVSAKSMKMGWLSISSCEGGVIVISYQVIEKVFSIVTYGNSYCYTAEKV